MPKINERNGYYFFLILRFQWGHMIEHRSISSKSVTPPNMCSLQSILKILILYQFVREVCCFAYSKWKRLDKRQNLCFHIHVLSLFRQNHYLGVFFSWGAMFLLEIYWHKQNAAGILYFLFPLESQQSPEGSECYMHHCSL